MKRLSIRFFLISVLIMNFASILTARIICRHAEGGGITSNDRLVDREELDAVHLASNFENLISTVVDESRWTEQYVYLVEDQEWFTEVMTPKVFFVHGPNQPRAVEPKGRAALLIRVGDNRIIGIKDSLETNWTILEGRNVFIPPGYEDRIHLAFQEFSGGAEPCHLKNRMIRLVMPSVADLPVEEAKRLVKYYGDLFPSPITLRVTIEESSDSARRYTDPRPRLVLAEFESPLPLKQQTAVSLVRFQTGRQRFQINKGPEPVIMEQLEERPPLR